jgi:hypothetical protein
MYRNSRALPPDNAGSFSTVESINDSKYRENAEKLLSYVAHHRVLRPHEVGTRARRCYTSSAR